MFETLFGAEMPLPVRFFIAFLIVLGLIGVTAWIVRRFGAERLGASTARGRQPRLAVIDAAPVDGRRRLILIRRDNVEHLLMIGGPTDVVVEANIVRAAAATRDTPAPTQRGQAPADAPPLRAAVTAETNMWPLQPEPVAPMARPQRSPVPVPAPVAEDPDEWLEPELPVPPPTPPRRPQRTADPLAGLADELSRVPELPRGPAADRVGGNPYAPPREPARPQREVGRQRAAAPPREPVREEPQFEPEPEPIPMPAREPARMREPQMREAPQVREAPQGREPQMREPQLQAQPAVTDPEFNANADQNLAEMAHRLEAALRRPARSNGPAEGGARGGAAEPANVQSMPAAPQRGAPAEGGAARAEPKPPKSLYDSLEKEMASLLGRPSGKS